MKHIFHVVTKVWQKDLERGPINLANCTLIQIEESWIQTGATLKTMQIRNTGFH